MTDPRRISTTLPRDLHERLAQVAREERRSLASMLAIAVEDWLRQRRKAREELRPSEP